MHRLGARTGQTRGGQITATYSTPHYFHTRHVARRVGVEYDEFAVAPRCCPFTDTDPISARTISAAAAWPNVRARARVPVRGIFFLRDPFRAHPSELA